MISALAPLAAVLLAGAGPAPAKATKGPATGLVRVAYEEAKNPEHDPLYQRMRDRKVLETFAEVLGTIRLPRPLTLRFAGCDGDSNAWYDTDDQSVTFCYEYVADIDKAAAGAAQYGISREDAVDGPIVFVLLHESGHALFDLLKVPILGREEDAADQVAAYALLRAGKPVARRMLRGAAWMWKHDASARKLDESDFADMHGLDAQRFYNMLCMAYGSDPEYFGDVLEKGQLPKDRAEGCEGEFQQVGYAVRKLISKSLDPAAVKRTRALHKAKWEAPPKTPAAQGAAPAPAEKK